MVSGERPMSGEEIDEAVRRFCLVLEVDLLIMSVDENARRLEGVLDEMDRVIAEYDRTHSSNQ